jgi:hypothetical protein
MSRKGIGNFSEFAEKLWFLPEQKLASDYDVALLKKHKDDLKYRRQKNNMKCYQR